MKRAGALVPWSSQCPPRVPQLFQLAADVGDWLTPRNGRTPAVVVSVAHLDDDERALVLGVLLLLPGPMTRNEIRAALARGDARV